MTEDELSRLIDDVHGDGYSHGRGEGADYDFEKQAILEAFVKLQQDNACLRGLIKQVEKLETIRYAWDCAFCGSNGCGFDGVEHTPDCPAFTPEGEVK